MWVTCVHIIPHTNLPAGPDRPTGGANHRRRSTSRGQSLKRRTSNRAPVSDQQQRDSTFRKLAAGFRQTGIGASNPWGRAELDSQQFTHPVSRFMSATMQQPVDVLDVSASPPISSHNWCFIYSFSNQFGSSLFAVVCHVCTTFTPSARCKSSLCCSCSLASIMPAAC